MDIKVGDRVTVVSEYDDYSELVGKHGRVVAIYDNNFVTDVILDDLKNPNCPLGTYPILRSGIKLQEEPVKDVFDEDNKVQEWLDKSKKACESFEKENRNMRNEILERWYEKNWDAINAANIKRMNELINEDSLVKRVSADIEAINTYLREELKIDNDQLTFNKELVTTDETDDKTDLCMKKMDELRAALDEKKADVYALLSMCDGDTRCQYEPFEILKTQGVIDEYLNIIVRDYNLSD